MSSKEQYQYPVINRNGERVTLQLTEYGWDDYISRGWAERREDGQYYLTEKLEKYERERAANPFRWMSE